MFNGVVVEIFYHDPFVHRMVVLETTIARFPVHYSATHATHVPKSCTKKNKERCQNHSSIKNKNPTTHGFDSKEKPPPTLFGIFHTNRNHGRRCICTEFRKNPCHHNDRTQSPHAFLWKNISTCPRRVRLVCQCTRTTLETIAPRNRLSRCQ